jgi:hypothetical protein
MFLFLYELEGIATMHISAVEGKEPYELVPGSHLGLYEYLAEVYFYELKA